MALYHATIEKQINYTWSAECEFQWLIEYLQIISKLNNYGQVQLLPSMGKYKVYCTI